MDRRIFGVALSGLLLVGGCSKPDEKLDQAEQSIQSWHATLTLTERQWAERRVPAVYIDQLVQAADKSLDEQAQSLPKIQGADATRQARLIDSIAYVRDRAHQLRATAGKGRS